MFDISPIQILIVLVIALLVFGPKRLPELGRNLGRGLREFKGSVSEFSLDDPPARTDGPRPASPAAVVPASDETEPAAATDEEELEGIVVPGDPPPRDG
jgi:sec-independent protein translocase protein TatA